jgi:hypothetical protein
MLLVDGEARVRVFDRAPAWASGWQPCAANNTYTFLHNLGVYPQYVHLEVAEHADGTGWRVPAMSSTNYDSANWRQTAMVNLSATNVTIRTQTSLAYFYRAGVAVAPSNGYCQVLLYNWTPDYDSGWLSISTAVADRDKLLQHGLGQIPSLVSLYVAQNADGSGWVVSPLGTYHYGYNNAVGIYNVTDKFTVIKGGAASVAGFIDAAGAAQWPAAGYVRFMAWR